MSGLKGVKSMSMGNGSADCLNVTDLRIGNAKLGGDITFSNNKSLLKILNDFSVEIKKLNEEIKDLKQKVESFETE